MMRSILLCLALLLTLSACQEVVDISALPTHYQALFRIAAARQGVGTDASSTFPWEWRAEIASAHGHKGQALHLYGLTCRIRIDISRLKPCRRWAEYDNGEQSFIVTSRHEIRHCQEGNSRHSKEPTSYMHSPSPCWPSD